MSSDNGALEREGQPIAVNLFPVRKESFSHALEVLTNKMPSEEEGIARGGLMINNALYSLRVTNFPAFDYMVERSRNIKGGEMFIKHWSWGISVAWRALQEEAESREVKIPKLKEDFIDEYREKQEGREERELQMEKVEKFKSISPEASSYIIDRVKSIYGESDPEQNPIYLGIAELHALFAEGCEDPKNYEQ